MRVLGVLLFNFYPFSDFIAKNLCVILALFLRFKRVNFGFELFAESKFAKSKSTQGTSQNAIFFGICAFGRGILCENLRVSRAIRG